MPRNMAMHDPETRVVSRESDEEVAASGESGSVATRRVDEGETVGGAVPDTSAFSYDVEIVTVEMDGVGKGDGGACLDPP